MTQKRILSGMQPTSQLHLGNYLGALKNWVNIQNEPNSECLYMVADLHAITVKYNPSDLLPATREVAAAFIAGGIDPQKSAIFVQSHLPHDELMWLLSSVTQMGKLSRMTQFKDKAGKNAERASLGLFSYPVLMAADILLYKATHVPVGDDQKQHLELTREIAATFNTRYDVDFFPQPEPVIMGAAPRVMSLRDGTKKMSKSDESENSRISLSDDADTIAKKIRKAKTDPHPVPSHKGEFEGRPEAENLMTIYAALSNTPMDRVFEDFGGKPFSAFKPALTALAVETLSPITKRMNDLLQDTDEIDKMLNAGNIRAASIADATLKQVRDIMGFWVG
jgi:tryptophanyl-tRNA synthetase